MSNKYNHPGRRGFLQKSLFFLPAAVASSLPGCHTTTDGGDKYAATTRGDSYKPGYFTDQEWSFINAAVARLIPADDRGPGAVEAGVPEFIDRQMQTTYATGGLWYMQGPFLPDAPPELGYQSKLVPQQIYRLGIQEADAWSQSRHGKAFAQLDAAAQDKVLAALDSGEAEFQAVSSSVFFNLLLTNTKEGFFCDPIHGGNRDMIGWKLIRFPGARADFMDWIERDERYPFPPVSIRGQRG